MIVYAAGDIHPTVSRRAGRRLRAMPTDEPAPAAGFSDRRRRAEKENREHCRTAELQRLMRDVDAGRHRRVYVFRLDRLTRMGIADTLASPA